MTSRNDVTDDVTHNLKNMPFYITFQFFSYLYAAVYAKAYYCCWFEIAVTS